MALYSCTTARAEPPVVGPRGAGHRPADGNSDMHGAPSRADREAAGRLLRILCMCIGIARPTRGLEPQRGCCGEGPYPQRPTTRPARGPAAAACDHECTLCGRGTGAGTGEGIAVDSRARTRPRRGAHAGARHQPRWQQRRGRALVFYCPPSRPAARPACVRPGHAYGPALAGARLAMASWLKAQPAAAAAVSCACWGVGACRRPRPMATAACRPATELRLALALRHVRVLYPCAWVSSLDRTCL